MVSFSRGGHAPVSVCAVHGLACCCTLWQRGGRGAVS
uniref:Uncharacterized protein n=1 Tax=Anguilla anguilla TaxID=7936 RepID=A0A0E9PQD4_ANGAN